MNPRRVALEMIGFLAVALLIALIADCQDAHASSRPILHRYEAARTATLVSDQYGAGYATRCRRTDRPDVRLCTMDTGTVLRVREQHTGYLVTQQFPQPVALDIR